jgi:hypothetical protein
LVISGISAVSSMVSGTLPDPTPCPRSPYTCNSRWKEHAVADASGSIPGRTAGRALDAETRERLLTLLQEELARAGDEALERGMTQEELSAQLDARIARLRTQITDLADGPPPR